MSNVSSIMYECPVLLQEMLIGHFITFYQLLRLCSITCRMSVAYSKVLSQHLPWDTEEITKILLKVPGPQQDANQVYPAWQHTDTPSSVTPYCSAFKIQNQCSECKYCHRSTIFTMCVHVCSGSLGSWWFLPVQNIASKLNASINILTNQNTVYVFLYLYDLFHILQSLWLTLDPGNVMKCNVKKNHKCKPQV
jgi:hypothetical protein